MGHPVCVYTYCRIDRPWKRRVMNFWLLASGHRAAVMTLWSIPRARRLISPSVDLID